MRLYDIPDVLIDDLRAALRRQREREERLAECYNDSINPFRELDGQAWDDMRELYETATRLGFKLDPELGDED